MKRTEFFKCGHRMLGSDALMTGDVSSPISHRGPRRFGVWLRLLSLLTSASVVLTGCEQNAVVPAAKPTAVTSVDPKLRGAADARAETEKAEGVSNAKLASEPVAYVDYPNGFEAAIGAREDVFAAKHPEIQIIHNDGEDMAAFGGPNLFDIAEIKPYISSPLLPKGTTLNFKNGELQSILIDTYPNDWQRMLATFKQSGLAFSEYTIGPVAVGPMQMGTEVSQWKFKNGNFIQFSHMYGSDINSNPVNSYSISLSGESYSAIPAAVLSYSSSDHKRSGAPVSSASDTPSLPPSASGMVQTNTQKAASAMALSPLPLKQALIQSLLTGHGLAWQDGVLGGDISVGEARIWHGRLCRSYGYTTQGVKSPVHIACQDGRGGWVSGDRNEMARQ